MISLGTGGDAIKAAGSIGDGDAQVGFTAKTAGTDGNSIEVDFIEAGVDLVEDTTASADGTEIDVTLAQTAAVEEANATLTTDLGSNADLTWTTQAADGTAGNDGSYQIQYISNPGAGSHSLVFFGAGNLSTVTFGPDATAQDILDYLDAHPDLDVYYTAALAEGSDGSGALAEGLWTFAGGVDATPADITATAADVKAAIEADTDSAALVDVGFGNGDGSGTVEDDTSVELSGGIDEDAMISTAADIKAAIEGTPRAAALISVSTTPGGTGAIPGSMDEANLAGGSDTQIFTSALTLDD